MTDDANRPLDSEVEDFDLDLAGKGFLDPSLQSEDVPGELSPDLREETSEASGNAGDYELMPPVERPSAVGDQNLPAEQGRESPTRPQGNRPADDIKVATSVLESLRRLTTELQSELTLGLGTLLLGILLVAPGLSFWLGVLLIVFSIAWITFWIICTLRSPKPRTPEDALRQYFGLIGRPLVSYRRIFGLLAEEAQRVPEFSNAASFAAYWRYQLAKLRSDDAWWKPVRIQVSDVNITHVSERGMAIGSFTLTLRVFGSAEVRQKSALRTQFVQGSDGLWYFLDGRFELC